MVDRAARTWWEQNATAQQLCLVVAAVFGVLGMLSLVHFLLDLTGPLAGTEQVSAAIGLSVCVNALVWAATWRRGRFRHLGTLVLAVLMLKVTAVAVYAALQVVLAQHLGVPYLQA